MRCSNCGSDNPDGLKFCNQCGTAFHARCSNCGFDNASGSRFCGQCGASLGASQQHGKAAPQNTGERRHLTVLFCDLVGSTELAARLDPEEWRQTVAAYHRAAADAIDRLGGHVAKYLGDGVMAYFGYPAAHDNDAERAARAGLAIIEAIAKLNQHLSSLKLSARVGIDSGAVVVGTGAGTEIEVFGEAPNIAARVQAAAAPDTVLISAATHRLVAGLFVVEDCGAQALKGVEQQVQLYRVIQPAGVRGRLEAAAASRGLTPFVGRQDELRLLNNRWQRVLDGEGQVVAVIGEAGIGKSRLVQQFRQQIAETPQVWIEGAAAPFYQNTPFYPVAEALWQLVWKQTLDRFGDYLGKLKNEGETRAEAESAQPPSPGTHVSREGGATDPQLTELESGLARAGIKASEAIPLIAPLLHLQVSGEYAPSALPPEQQRRRLLATLIEWLLGTARAQPLVIVIEDLHWADPSTLELIELLLEQAATVRMLVVYTARPEFHPEWPLRAHHTQITLNRLNARNVREMIAQVAAQNSLANETLDAVVERTSGVPLFVEELTRALLESGNASISRREIPVTLHDSLMARLDRLGSAKEVLQIGSVIGGDFSYQLLHAIHSLSDDDLQRELRRLTEADLLYVRGLAPDAIYQFKHALIRDAAYEALLKSRRKELHRLVAQRIDEKFPDMKDVHPEILAYHWTEAGDAQRAIAEWLRAGKAAEARNAFKEAEQSYKQALAPLMLLPECSERDRREQNLWQSLYKCFQITSGFAAPETIAALERAVILAEKTGEGGELVSLVAMRATTSVLAGDLAAAIPLAQRAAQLELRGGIRSTAVQSALIITHYWSADFGAAEQDFATASELWANFGTSRSEASYPYTVRIPFFAYASWNAWTIGRGDLARTREADMKSAADINRPYDLAWSGYYAAHLKLFMRDDARCAELAAQALELSVNHRFAFTGAASRCILGHARAQLGHPTEGAALIREGIANMAESGTGLLVGNFTAYLAAAQHRQGLLREALETVEQALRANPDILAYRPEMLRLRGELRLELGQTEMAANDFSEALALARKLRAKAWELRSTMSLARLLDDQGLRAEARTMLAEIYNWFTEGFDTPDLKDAKALLDRLMS